MDYKKTHIKWYTNGQVKSLYRYNSDGSKHGWCYEWWDDGCMKYELIYDDDLLVGSYLVHPPITQTLLWDRIKMYNVARSKSKDIKRYDDNKYYN